VVLTQLTKYPALLHFKKVFPTSISNKRESQLQYEAHNGLLKDKLYE